MFFFFKQKTAYEMRISYWSSDVCSSDLTGSYEVTNVVAATAGTAVGSSVPTAFDSPVVIDASNKSFTATVDGRTSLTINLPEGSYASGDRKSTRLNSSH